MSIDVRKNSTQQQLEYDPEQPDTDVPVHRAKREQATFGKATKSDTGG